jgi:hypothetical protein
MSKMVASAFHIVKGKFDQWQAFANKLKHEYHNDYKKSRENAGIRERAFLQHTPEGDMVIVTLEGGDDPLGAFGKINTSQDTFIKWFVQQVKEVHGVDLSMPFEGPPPELVVDSHSV